MPGLYLYDNEVVAGREGAEAFARAANWRSPTLNVAYLRRGQLRVHRLSRGFAWLDAGTSSSLHEASAYVQTIEKRAGIKIGCPEEAAFRSGFISLAAIGGSHGPDARSANIETYLARSSPRRNGSKPNMILLLGGTGYIGQAFVRELERRRLPFRNALPARTRLHPV